MSCLVPSIPAEFFELAAKAIADGTGIKVDLQFEQRISGPLPGDVNPFGTSRQLRRRAQEPCARKAKRSFQGER
jgi:hypothetical protein